MHRVNRTSRSLLMLLYVCLLIAVRSASASDAVVTIQNNGKNRTAAFGTGFISSPEGKVVTCYHVVDGATSIKIFYKKGGVYSAHLLRIAPDRDMAELQMDKVPLPTDFLRITKVLPPHIQESELTIEGYAAGLFNQKIVARATQDSFVRSAKVKAQNDERLFNQKEVNVLLLNLTIYNGMSGAPVMTKDGHVIGILSGSLNQGGSLAWAIAIENLDPEFTTAVNLPLQSFVWPPMTLMTAGWQSLRRRDGVGKELLDTIESFTYEANLQETRFSTGCNSLNRRLATTSKLIDLLATRPDLENVSISVLNREGLERELGTSVSQLRDEMRPSAEAGIDNLGPIFAADRVLAAKYMAAVSAAQAFEADLPKTENNKAIKSKMDGQFQVNLWRQTMMGLIAQAEGDKIQTGPIRPPTTVGDLRSQTERQKLSAEGEQGVLCHAKLMETVIANETALDFRELLLADLVDVSNQ